MGLDLQLDGLTAGLAGHCQPDKEYPQSQKGQVTKLYLPSESSVSEAKQP